MTANKVLVVYYSRGGNTRRVADEIAQAFAACDVEVIRDTVERRGILGYLRSVYQAVRGQQPELEPPRYDPGSYRLVVIGTPVWASSVCAPVRSYITAHAPQLGKVAFFLTHGGSGRARVFRQMAELTGKAPLATLGVRELELRRGSFRERVRDLVEELERALPDIRATTAPHGVAA